MELVTFITNNLEKLVHVILQTVCNHGTLVSNDVELISGFPEKDTNIYTYIGKIIPEKVSYMVVITNKPV